MIETGRRFSPFIDKLQNRWSALVDQTGSFIIGRYKDESDYALKFMESSWKDMQKEEARRYGDGGSFRSFQSGVSVINLFGFPAAASDWPSRRTWRRRRGKKRR